ncbi:MAG: hypothetical protein KBA26_11830 [Candidatus Delongbacteria bacterium]|nr:hypothetical protein [Candidatus Delongbacteria bacterium]
MKHLFLKAILIIVVMGSWRLAGAQRLPLEFRIPPGEELEEFRQLARNYPEVDSLQWDSLVLQLKSLLYRLENRGFPAARLAINSRSESGYLIDVEPGPLMRWEAFRFNGVRSRIYSRVFNPLRHRRYNWSEIQTRSRVLLGYSFIRSIRFDSLILHSTSDRMTAVFQVQETKRSDLQCLLSYQDKRWLGFIRFKQLDFLSQAAELNLNYERMQSGLSQLECSLNYPFPFNWPIEARISVGQRRKEMEYQRLRLSSALSYLNPQSFWRFGIQGAGEWTQPDKEWITPYSVYDQLEGGVRLWRDTYSSPLQSYSGMKWELTYQVKHYRGQNESLTLEQLDAASLNLMIPSSVWGAEWKARWCGFTRKSLLLEDDYLIPVGGAEWMMAYPAEFFRVWRIGYGYGELFLRWGDSGRLGIWYERAYVNDGDSSARMLDDWGINLMIPIQSSNRWTQIRLAFPGQITMDEMVLYVKTVF